MCKVDRLRCAELDPCNAMAKAPVVPANLYAGGWRLPDRVDGAGGFLTG